MGTWLIYKKTLLTSDLNKKLPFDKISPHDFYFFPFFSICNCYILPLVVNCFFFSYNIFVLDVRFTVSFGHYNSRRMHADRHTCMDTDMQACVYACTHTRTHTYIHKYSCCFFSGCGKPPITHKDDKLSRAQRGLNSQSSDRGNIVSCQLSSKFDSRHRDCANKHSPKGGDNPSGMSMC